MYATIAKPPKEKIAVCISADREWFLWINTNAAFHGQGQIPLTAADHPALKHDCFLDASRVLSHAKSDIAHERDEISAGLAKRIHAELSASPPAKLPRTHLQVILEALAAQF